MATRQKTSKPTKKEMVMPFHDEHNFVVPKKGGFAQPDNEHYAMLVAPITLGGTTDTTTPNQPTQTGQGLGTSTIESGNTTSTSSPTQTHPPISTSTTTTDTPTLPPLANLPTTTIGSDTTTLPTSTTTPPRVGTLVDTITPITNTPITSTLPTFPNWSTLDCTTLRSEIDRLKSTLLTSRFSDPTTLDAYNTQIALGEATYTSKCNTPSTPSTPAIAIVPTPSTSGGGGGIGGGGGGGGLGEPPSDETPTEEAPKPSNKKSWLVLLGVIGLIYLLTKKSK
jgi:hypothetical protein